MAEFCSMMMADGQILTLAQDLAEDWRDESAAVEDVTNTGFKKVSKLIGPVSLWPSESLVRTQTTKLVVKKHTEDGKTLAMTFDGDKVVLSSDTLVKSTKGLDKPVSE